MKNFFVILILVLFVSGCTYEGKKIGDYFDDPASLIQDPHFASYKEKRDELESRYLRKEITYADYKKELSALDEKYDREVQKRDAIIGE